MRLHEESLSVTCVGSAITTNYLKRLLGRVGVETEQADVLIRAPKSGVVICEIKMQDAWQGGPGNDNWVAWEKLFQRRLRYFRNASRFTFAHELLHVLLFSGSTADKYVDTISTLVDKLGPSMLAVRSAEDAVYQVIWALHQKQKLEPTASAIDGPDIEAVTNDLRDRKGQLNAEKVKKVFGLETMSELAHAAGLTRQALDANPSTRGVLPVLEELERIARVRALPQLQAPETFRAWWRRKLPALDNRSPYDTWKAEETRKVIDLVDSLLTGDFRG